MKIINRLVLRDFYQRHPKLESFLEAWIQKVSKETWLTPADVAADFPQAAFENNNKINFVIAPGEYYLLVAVHYSAQVVSIKWIGSLHQNLKAQSC